ncbi:farnesol dehydrogenase-like isoform X1 [Periplaneta americana]|uniref:farnesol dehydrogenase-like isoform X1 n=1 Tax=Periplaneta americana TaxID=6978 RepID=UPI0037E80297
MKQNYCSRQGRRKTVTTCNNQEMERWSGKVAIVTGASSGIGAAVTRALVERGLKVVGLARRVHRLQELSAELCRGPGKLYPLQCDITNEEDILCAFSWLRSELGGVDVLVNNAGVLNEIQFHDFKTEDWLQMINVNVVGLTLCTREAVSCMKSLGIENGHIIHINSFLGHTMSNLPGFNMYAATKHAVTTLTESLRRELAHLKSGIKVSSISPGMVKTELLSSGDNRTLGPEVYNAVTCLEASDVADAVVYVLDTPPHIQVHELTILPLGQPI